MEYGFFDFLTLLGSLGLFLYGMKVMSDALMQLAGDKMRSILASATSNRFLAVLTGFTITAIIQSSSATSLMVVSFANAGLLSLTESIGVIMGANIGTTVTAWLISILGFKVSMAAVAIPLVALGFVFSLSEKKNLKQWGYFVIGFAILFIGLQYLKDSVPDLKSNPQILAFLAEYTNKGFLSIILFMVIGTVLTLVVQSSSATMALTLVMCYQGWIPFDMAAAMVLGQNIGTTITANLAAMIANYKAKRAARAHFIFNMVGVVFMLALLKPFLYLIDLAIVRFEGASPFEQNMVIPVALSLFHTTFNIINTFMMLAFIPQISKAVKWMVPKVKAKKIKIEQPRFLNKSSLKYPQTGIKALLDESLRLLETTTYKVITHGLDVHREEIESDIDLKKVIKNIHKIDLDVDKIYYEKFKNIYSQIVEYATKLQSQFDLDEDKIKTIRSILRANRLMVGIVKSIKPLHKNMNYYLDSDNEHIQKEYNHLREMILTIVRLTRKAKRGQLEQKYIEKCIKLKEELEQNDVLLDGTIDRLVRKQLINNQMATSLMNDSALAIQIAHNLVDVSSLLYLQRDIFKDEDVEPASTDAAIE